MTSNLREDYIAKRRVTLVCAALNLVLSGVKVVLGVLGQSQALIADGIHSLSDLASDAMVLVAVRFASDDADLEHPYGHARFETIATVALGVLLLMVAGGLVLDAISRIRNPDQLLQPGYLALVGAVISILVKEWMYRYNLRVARELGSELMRANAWHHRSDAVSSLIVLVGVLGAMLGYVWLDAVAAIGVALLIAKIGWDLGWASVRELVDTGLPEEELQSLRATIHAVDGVESSHDLRTRRMGKEVLVEVHVLVGSQVTVSEGHMIGDSVRASLLSAHPEITQVLVHIDPEDDEGARLPTAMPGREQLTAMLEELWRDLPLAGQVTRINLHYLQGHVDIEVFLPLSALTDLEEGRATAALMAQQAQGLEGVGKASVYFG